jgi:hypothetical protein
MRILALGISAAVISTACGTLGGHTTAVDAALPDVRTVFVPMDPIPYEEFFEDSLDYWDVNGDGTITTNDKLYLFPNESVQVRVAQYDAESGVTFPMVAVSVRGGNYEVIVDYAKYRIDRTEDDYVYQSGLGIRLRATIVAFEGGIDISSLYGIGIAAKQSKLSGTLRFETIGLSGRQISPLIPLPSEISIESIQAAMQAAAAIKANLYNEEDVRIYPQVFAYKCVPEQQLIESAEPAPSSVR